MTYQMRMAKLMQSDRPQDWAAESITIAIGLLKTSHLALENFDAGMFSDEEVRHAVTYSLEAALGLLAVADEGVDILARSGGCEDSPIALMHKEINRLDALCDAAHAADKTEEGDALSGQMMKLADEILTLPARNATDILHKIMGTTVNGDHEIGDGPPEAKNVWQEMRHVLGMDQ